MDEAAKSCLYEQGGPLSDLGISESNSGECNSLWQGTSCVPNNFY